MPAPGTITASATDAFASGSRSRPAGNDAIREVALVDEEQIDVARQPHVLEPIVEQVDRCAELRSPPDGPRDSGPDTTSTGTPGSVRASSIGSSPARATSVSTRSPSDTTVTPALGFWRA